MALKGEELCSEAAGPVGACTASTASTVRPHRTQRPVDEADQTLDLNPSTLEEALKTIRLLQGRAAKADKQPSSGDDASTKSNGGSATTAQQLLVWRRRALAYEEAVARVSRASQDQLQLLSGQLMLLKARLVRKQKDIGRMLTQREAVIQRQQRTIHQLQARLLEAGLDMVHAELDSPTGETNLDSLNDSDSAVILEDGPGSDHEHATYPRFRHYSDGGSGGVTVARSVSDAAESLSAKWRQQQFIQASQAQQRNNGFNFLRRPEVLETVYSVEEDGDGDGGGGGTSGSTTTTGATTASSGTQLQNEDPDFTSVQQPHSRRTSSHSYKGDSNSSIDDTISVDDSSCSTATSRQWGPGHGPEPHYGSLEVLTDACAVPSVEPRVPPSPNHVTTYNRVMSNHRSVTKPKDVKYKRINKAKSKSLEELRGRLRNWVDKGVGITTSNKFISLDQSYA